MGMWAAVQPMSTTTPGYDEVMESVKDLAAKLDTMADDYGLRIAANEAEITVLHNNAVNYSAEKAKAESMSAKLKALVPAPAMEPQPKGDI